MTLYWS